MRQALTQMQSSLADNTWTVREKLALTCRILFDHGHDSGLGGQISIAKSVPSIVSVSDLTTTGAIRRARFAQKLQELLAQLR